MSYRNFQHIPIPDVRRMFYQYVDSIGSYQEQAESPEVQQLETALASINSASFKTVHPLLINRYRLPTLKFSDSPMKVIGLDIETNADTGRPMLLGFWQNGEYSHIYKPTLESFFNHVRGVAENGYIKDFITWGNLDIQCILRLFNPDEKEREKVSRGLSANIKDGVYIARPPILRRIGKSEFYVAHYIPGRSLKLGYMENGFDKSIWIFNCSQFYADRIADTAKGLGLVWRDFDKNTHRVDWAKFEKDFVYHELVLDSNRQDARIVNELQENLQQRFYEVFDCYPKLLVSTGSLTDAAVSKKLSVDIREYQSNSWRWLVSNVWKGLRREDLAASETLLCEAFSAGYVDQFAVGYFDKVCTADIAAAYPHKIRALPDLRYSKLFVGKGNLEWDLLAVGMEIETAIIRGYVNIPETLKFHPITVKTYARENHRPTGKFFAAYTLEERRFCEKYGAKFSDEEYVIIGLTERKPSPIAGVSEELGEFRNRLLAQMKDSRGNERRVLYGQQYLVKVVDNSIYGKTVMTTEVVEDLEGEPQITGYIAGDRFNMLYGSLITARTRIQIAEACMKIVESGGRPIMTMTDSIYWQGTPDMLPADMVRSEKTPGYFESPEYVEHFYLLKTGQYEYRKSGEWYYKMRGLNVDRDLTFGDGGSFYRRMVKQSCKGINPHTHPEDVRVMVSTRRLISVGAKQLDLLGAIVKGRTEIRPFLMSSKQVESFVTNWRECLDGHVWLETPSLGNGSYDMSASTYPLAYLRRLYEQQVGLAIEAIRQPKRVRNQTLRSDKWTYVYSATLETGRLRPKGRITDMSWEQLIGHYGVERR